MTHLPRLLILAAGMLMAVGCSDSRTATVADASQKKDTTLGDQGRADGAPTPDAPASDAPRKDAAPARDQATRDAAPADLPTPVDSTSRDATPVDSTNRDATALDQSTPTKDGGGTTCATDQDCKVFEDCCECTAVFSWVNRPICKKMCFVTTCTALGFTQPTAYCAAGHCLLTEGGGSSCKTTRTARRSTTAAIVWPYPPASPHRPATWAPASSTPASVRAWPPPPSNASAAPASWSPSPSQDLSRAKPASGKECALLPYPTG